MPKKAISDAVTWLSEQILDPGIDPILTSKAVLFYEKFQFNKIKASVGDFVLISNADSAAPDTEEGSDPAQIIALYESNDPDLEDKFRARVQWFSRPLDLPNGTNRETVNFEDLEVVEDHRPFNNDVSIETFFKRCHIVRASTNDNLQDIINNKTTKKLTYACRYRLIPISKRKFNIEPVLEDERRQLELLKTPKSVKRNTLSNPTTPNSLTKRMNRVSLSERNWSVTKTESTKILLKRAIFADTANKLDSPKKTPSRKLKPEEIEELLADETDTVSDEELPTLVIKQGAKSDSYTLTFNTKEKKIEDIENIEYPKQSIRVKKPTKYFDNGDDFVSPLNTPKKTRRGLTNDSENKIDTTPKKTQRSSKQHAIDTTPINTTPRKSRRLSLLTDSESIDSPSRRSARVKKPSKYYDEDFELSAVMSPKKATPILKVDMCKSNMCTPIKRPSTPNRKIATPKSRAGTPSKKIATPKRVSKRYFSESDDDFEPMTPKSKTPSTKTPRKSVSKKQFTIGTPYSNPVDVVTETVKNVKSLKGREQQMEEIYAFVQNKLLDKASGCMYISGVPGTGKTATVCTVLKALHEDPNLPSFNLVEVNGMRVAEPRQAYVHIYKQLTGKTVGWEQAASLLEKRFTSPGTKRVATVLLVDELDALCTRRQDVLYNIVEWTTHEKAQLAVLAVANTMDLPERALAAKVSSRLGLTRLTFPPYTHAQLQKIVATRLQSANVTADALQYIARKVASISGDARRAMALCERALEIAAGTQVGMNEVQRALDEAASGTSVRAIQTCSPLERLVLRAAATEVERTGTDETTLTRVLRAAEALASLDGRPYKKARCARGPTSSQALLACARLAARRLLVLEPAPLDPRLLLNVSVDDVYYAVQNLAA